MKKIALTSLLAMFVVSGAHAAINDNPLYRPDAGKFVSETMMASHSQNTTAAWLMEEFSYGVTDRLSVGVSTVLGESDWFDAAAWDDFAVNANWRVLNDDMWKIDVFGEYGLSQVWGDHESFLDKDVTDYKWTVGAQAGYTSGNLTLAGHVAFDYENMESFNWDDDGAHTLRAGITGFLKLNCNWGLLAEVEYNADLDDWSDNNGFWTGIFGVNYNINQDMFVAGYVEREMSHRTTGTWEVDDGFGFGAKFGIQF